MKDRENIKKPSKSKLEEKFSNVFEKIKNPFMSAVVYGVALSSFYGCGSSGSSNNGNVNTPNVLEDKKVFYIVNQDGELVKRNNFRHTNPIKKQFSDMNIEFTTDKNIQVDSLYNKNNNKLIDFTSNGNSSYKITPSSIQKSNLTMGDNNLEATLINDVSSDFGRLSVGNIMKVESDKYICEKDKTLIWATSNIKNSKGESVFFLRCSDR